MSNASRRRAAERKAAKHRRAATAAADITLNHNEAMPEGYLPFIDRVFTWEVECDSCHKRYVLASDVTAAAGFIDDLAEGRVKCRECLGRLGEPQPEPSPIISG